MLDVIQNVACVELTADASENRITFLKDILRDKKIRSIFLYASSEETVALNPYRNEAVSSIADVRSASLYITLVNKQGKVLIDNLSINDYIITPEYLNLIDLNINDTIDFEKSFISVMGDLLSPLSLLMYVFYNSQPERVIPESFSTITTKDIPVDELYADVSFFSIFGKLFEKPFVKKILIGGRNVIYLDIITRNGYRVENLPHNLFNRFGRHRLNFNLFRIDSENSFIRLRQALDDGGSSITIIS